MQHLLNSRWVYKSLGYLPSNCYPHFSELGLLPEPHELDPGWCCWTVSELQLLECLMLRLDYTDVSTSKSWVDDQGLLVPGNFLSDIVTCIFAVTRCIIPSQLSPTIYYSVF